MLRQLLSLPLRLITGLSDALARLERRIEKRTQTGYATKGGLTGKADRWLSKVLAVMIWPLVALAGAVDRLTGVRRKASINVAADQKSLHRKLQRSQAKDEARERLQRSWIVRGGQLLFLPVVSLATFSWTLLRTRGRAMFWWGLPLLAVVGAIGVVVYQTTFVDQRRIAARYESAVAQAISAGDFQQAELFQRKLEQLGVRTDQGEFNTAAAIGESGDIEAAAIRMEAIASPEAIGNPSAHFWLAQRLIDEKISRYEWPENLELALAHLGQLKRRTGNRPEINFLEALALAKLGRLDESSAAFGESPREFVDAAGLKMQVETARKDETAARAAAMIVQRHLSKLKDSGDPLTEIQSQLDVDSTVLLDDAQAAALAIRRWYETNPESPAARLSQGSLHLNEFDQWLSDPQQAGVAAAAERLVESSQLIPDEQMNAVRQRLDKIVKGRGNPAMDTAYQALLDSPETSGVALEFLATAAAAQEDWPTADRIYAMAAKRSPSFDRIWNNWAYVLDNAFPDRRDEALAYVNKAVELRPDEAAYYETRGTILIHLQNWEDAIRDLEIALNGLGSSKPIHDSLAIAYEKVGDSRTASLHREAAK